MKRNDRLPWVVLALFLAAIACSTVTPAVPATQTAVPPAESPTAAVSEATQQATEEPSAIPPAYRYSVVLLPADGQLDAHTEPGADAPVAGTFPPDYAGLVPTGRVSMIGPSAWTEVQLPAGGTAWVNRKNLTETVDSAVFCADTRPLDRFSDLKQALLNNDGRLLTPIVSPVHGLTVEYIRNGIPKVYDAEEASFVFGRLEVVNWGLGPGSGLPVEGSFSELVQPDLYAVLEAAHETHCDSITLGGASYNVEWPFRWQNIHYYSLFKPGSVDVELDWMTWVAGVEYVDGAPYLFSLTRYTWEP